MDVLVADGIQGVGQFLDRGLSELLRVSGGLINQQLIHLGLSCLEAVGDAVRVLGLQWICQ